VTGPAFDRRSIPPGARESRWIAPDGHAIRLLHWVQPAGPPRGSLLFMPGRGDFYEKYLETFEHWRDRGWCVTAADWRGQAGSGRNGTDAHTGHVPDFGCWIADLAALWRDWSQQRPGPLVLVGHSMGGHLALRAAAEKALVPAPAALVLVAPMLDVQPERIPLSLRRLLAWVRCATGDPRRPAWKWSERPGELPAFRQHLLTHDADRYADEVYWREARPALAMGTGSWGWVRAALASIGQLRRRDVLAQVTVPVLIVATKADRLVGTRAMQRAAALLPHAQTLWFGAESAHEILREADPVRERALAQIDRFLERTI
jgi:lysophospholipase